MKVSMGDAPELKNKTAQANARSNKDIVREINQPADPAPIA